MCPRASTSAGTVVCAVSPRKQRRPARTGERGKRLALAAADLVADEATGERANPEPIAARTLPVWIGTRRTANTVRRAR